MSDQASVYRNTHPVGLFRMYRRNIRAALERIIEKAFEVDVNASAMVAAVQTYAKINAAGEWTPFSPTEIINSLCSTDG